MTLDIKMVCVWYARTSGWIIVLSHYAVGIEMEHTFNSSIDGSTVSGLSTNLKRHKTLIAAPIKVAYFAGEGEVLEVSIKDITTSGITSLCCR